jgi:hypothetical protein
MSYLVLGDVSDRAVYGVPGTEKLRSCKAASNPPGGMGSALCYTVYLETPRLADRRQKLKWQRSEGQIRKI